jgi:prepilin-type N-terminal cleavage/methylation domain-containing protein
MYRQKGFTLIELLIVVGIVAVIAVGIILAINPAQLLKQARDSRRISDMTSLTKALAYYQANSPTLSMGSTSSIYVSVPDSSSVCTNLGLSAAPSGYTYACSTSSNYQKTDNTGWIPINFNALQPGSPLSALPVDPVNTTSTLSFYAYTTSGSEFAVTALMESTKYAAVARDDGGSNLIRFEKGTNLGLAAFGTQAFADNFNDNSIDSAKWTTSNSADVSITETSNEMRFAADSSFSGSLNVAYLTSVPVFNFTGKRVDVDVPSPSTNLGNSGGSPSGGSILNIADTNNSNNSIAIYSDQSSMGYRRSNNGSYSILTTGLGISDTKWRIEHVSADNTWKFSTWNGSSWVLRFTSVAANWNPTSVTIGLIGYIYGPNQVNVTTRFDNIDSDATY